jgi:NAD(P)-dependent dehydrogenase (short-subunit alcohol dehydrogenase family)
MARALVVGANGSLGRAIAAELEAEGHQVLGVRRASSIASEKDANVKTVNEIAHLGDDFNMTDFDCVFLAVGSFHPMQFLDLPASHVREEISANLLDPMLAVQSLLRTLPRDLHQMRRDIVLIGSTSSFEGFSGTASYCAAKFGLRGFVSAMNQEFVHSGIRFWLASMGTMDNAMGSKVGANQSTLLAPADVASEIIRRVLREDNFFEPEFVIRRRVLTK